MLRKNRRAIPPPPLPSVPPFQERNAVAPVIVYRIVAIICSPPVSDYFFLFRYRCPRPERREKGERLRETGERWGSSATFIKICIPPSSFSVPAIVTDRRRARTRCSERRRRHSGSESDATTRDGK